jgi:hypothetical protein
MFHIWIWVHRGLPVDFVALSNLVGIQFPAFIALWAALSLSSERANK